MLKLAFRNIFRNRLRNSFALAVIAFGVAALIVTGGFVEDIFLQLREATIHSQFGHLQIYKEGFQAEGRQNPYRYMLDEPGQLVEQLSVVPGVADAMARVSFSGLLSNGRADLPIMGVGMQPDSEAHLGSFIRMTAGRKLADTDEYGIAIGEGIAQSMRLEVGDFVTVLTATPDGALNSLDFDIIGIFQSFSREYDSSVVQIPLSTAQFLLDVHSAHSIVLSLDETDMTDRMLTDIKQQFRSAGLEIKPWYELADFYQKTVALYKRQFAVLQAIIMIMVLLVVTNSINMSIYERTGEFGTLMALGQRNSEIFILVVIENVMLGILGAVTGLLAGVLLAKGLSSIGIAMPPPPNSSSGYIAHIQLSMSTMVVACVVGASATVLAAILSARKLKHLPVAEALRHSI
jgi:putative ABC transport system permease protein